MEKLLHSKSGESLELSILEDRENEVIHCIKKINRFLPTKGIMGLWENDVEVEDKP